MTELSLQAVGLAVRELVFRAGPAMSMAAILISTWALSRFIAKYQEQQRVLQHLPEIVRTELERRDAELKSLRTRVAELELERRERISVLRGAWHRLGALQDLLVGVLPTSQHKRLEAPPRA